jgi:hypothetical protein
VGEGTISFDNYQDRRHQRTPYKSNLIIIPSRARDVTLAAISLDISQEGICIYTFKPLKEGEDVVFKDTLQVPHRKGNVRWVKQIKPSIYMAGVMLFA